MNLAVKFWKDNPNKPLDFPGDWPWECREIGDATEYGAPGEWKIMSLEQYNAYRAEVEPLVDEWENSPDTVFYKMRVIWNRWFG